MMEAQQLDRYVVARSLAGVATVIGSAVVKPTDLMGHFAVDVQIVVTFFAALPLRTRTKMLPGTVFVAAELAQLLRHKQPHSTGIGRMMALFLILRRSQDTRSRSQRALKRCLEQSERPAVRLFSLKSQAPL